MNIVTTYTHGSGLSHRDCCFVGQRYDGDRGFRSLEGECWVMSARNASPTRTDYRWQFGTIRWFVGLWRSPGGATFVADDHGDVHMNPDVWGPDHHYTWTSWELGVPLAGLWGLAEDHVFTWGGTLDDDFPLLRWDGASWERVPDPGFDVRAMHGTDPDHLYAVGVDGGIARWDGARWHLVESPVDETLISVFAASVDEVYATGAWGSLLQGGPGGWVKIAQGPGPQMPLHAVAKWNGELWVGAGQFGLLRRVGASDELECLKPNLLALGLDARGDLVITCENMIAGTSDGQAFWGTAKDVLLNERADKPLGHID